MNPKCHKSGKMNRNVTDAVCYDANHDDGYPRCTARWLKHNHLALSAHTIQWNTGIEVRHSLMVRFVLVRFGFCLCLVNRAIRMLRWGVDRIQLPGLLQRGIPILVESSPATTEFVDIFFASL